ncbi:flagellar filament capping protein FliD [Thiohalobacter sp. IOR34]|uniref:flagellar filament capping protein FliD n=1 Tax=Thiohalobacter sp. IOR34 TaxID=3057176 RepID=UPI0025B1FAE5|nr:flagellar filament capping protein FliD [Thiohalobacter sp. IOR34]WJW74582.1 flagellar filament capping protein FliD [Thiohalobacter sp. IOR34]
MATLSVSGLGSGLDIEGIVTQLMAIERQPLDRLESRKQEFQTQLSGYGQLKSALSTFQSAMDGLGSTDKFKVFTTTSSDSSVLGASASSAAEPGSYAVTITQLAQAHKMASGLTGIADENTSIGATGTLQIDVGSSSFSVVIDSSNNTLAGIRDAINDASDNAGVTATILNVDDGAGGTESRLVLTSDETGTDNALTVSDASGDVASTLSMATVTGYDAQDAVLTVDGFSVTSSSNSVTGAIQGVTLELEAAGSATLEVAYDKSAVQTSVETFVAAYNSLQSTISSLREGSLEADSTLLSIQSSIRDEFNTTPTGLTTSLEYLSEIGIKTERDGSLTLDTSVLSDALDSDYDGVAELMANDDQGYAFRLEAVAKELLDIEGVIETRTDGIDTRIDTLDDRIANMEYRLEGIEARYRSQFTALDTLLSQLQTTSNYLSQQLSSLPT